MKIKDLESVWMISDVHEIESVLRQRDSDGNNTFWIYDEEGVYPKLCILARMDQAALFYLPEEEDPGYRSLDLKATANPMHLVNFAMSRSPADDISVPNNALIPFALSVSAVEEFFTERKLPSNVIWFHL